MVQEQRQSAVQSIKEAQAPQNLKIEEIRVRGSIINVQQMGSRSKNIIARFVDRIFKISCCLTGREIKDDQNRGYERKVYLVNQASSNHLQKIINIDLLNLQYIIFCHSHLIRIIYIQDF